MSTLMDVSSQASLFSFAAQTQSPAVDVTAEWAKALAQPLNTATFTVLDLETTGLNPKKSAITEITAIRFVNGQEQAMFSTLVQPGQAIPPEVEDLTGITNAMVASAPPLVMVMADLMAFLGQTPLIVGHNISFDLAFLREKTLEAGLLEMEDRLSYERAFCTKALAQKIIPGLPSYEGILVATQCGYHNNNPHRAEADVRMAAAILFALIEKRQAADSTCQRVSDLLNYQGPLKPR